jgi:hypothetical protein
LDKLQGGAIAASEGTAGMTLDPDQAGEADTVSSPGLFLLVISLDDPGGI